MKRTATIKCITPCVLYSLSKKQLDEVLLHHPQMTAAIRAIAEERLRLSQLEQKTVIQEESVTEYSPVKHSAIQEDEAEENHSADKKIIEEGESLNSSEDQSLL